MGASESSARWWFPVIVRSSGDDWPAGGQLRPRCIRSDLSKRSIARAGPENKARSIQDAGVLCDVMAPNAYLPGRVVNHPLLSCLVRYYRIQRGPPWSHASWCHSCAISDASTLLDQAGCKAAVGIRVKGWMNSVRRGRGNHGLTVYSITMP